MERPWYQKLFGRARAVDLESTQTRAEQGDAEAQFGLGLKYASSAGEAQDYPRAAHWYGKAADQCHSLAQFNLGLMYAQGQGVAQDDTQAVLWIRRAAEQGDAGAQHNLGTRSYGASIRGLPADALESKIEAYKWFQLAAAQGYKGSDTACERVTLTMTLEEAAEGNDRAAAFAAAKLTNSPSE